MSSPLAVTERHRRKQLTLATSVMKSLLPVTASLRAALSADDPSVTMPDWLDLALRIILGGRSESEVAGYDYYGAVKKAATGSQSSPIFDDVRPLPEIEKIRVSLLATGPGVYRRKLAQGATEQQALRAAEQAVLGAAMRHVLDGGRGMVVETARADREARGWIRVTDGNPCAFCAMLATRGFAAMKGEGGLYVSKEAASVVVKGRSRAPGEKYHDNCGCTAMPVFGKSFEIPGDAEKWEKLYSDSTKGYSGADKLKAFRRAYKESQKAPESD